LKNYINYIFNKNKLNFYFKLNVYFYKEFLINFFLDKKNIFFLLNTSVNLNNIKVKITYNSLNLFLYYSVFVYLILSILLITFFLINIFNYIYLSLFISFNIYLFFFLLFDLIFYSNVFYIYIDYYILNLDFNVFSNYLIIYNIIVSYLCFLFFFLKVCRNISINIIILLLTIFSTIFLFCSNNLYTFFFFYEFLMLPSIVLIFFSSPSLRSKIITFYFILWTQLGSFFIFVSIIFLYKNNYIFFSYCININNFYLNIVGFMLFLGFGIKVPIWPFHFWITKVHVEVNTAFSIYLSGILVKVALLGLYKFSSLFIKFAYFKFIILIVIIGIIDVSIKINNQIDFKKIVAFCTIFEMNIILFNLIFLNYLSTFFIFYFCVLHTSLSFLFFFLSDIFYKKFNTRCINSLYGLNNNYLITSLVFTLSVIFFNGLPMTLKFSLELIMLSKLINLNVLLFIVILTSQLIFLIFFNKIMYCVLFGLNSFYFLKKSKNDISLFELFLIILNLSTLVLL